MFEKMSCFSTRVGGSFYFGFVMFFERSTHTPPPLNNFNETWNNLILLTSERIK